MNWRSYPRRNGHLTTQGYSDLFEDLMEYYSIDPFADKNYLKDSTKLNKEIKDEERLHLETGQQPKLSVDLLEKGQAAWRGKLRGEAREGAQKTKLKHKLRSVEIRTGHKLYRRNDGVFVYRSQSKYKGKEVYRWRDTKGRFARAPERTETYSPAKSPPELPR